MIESPYHQLYVIAVRFDFRRSRGEVKMLNREVLALNRSTGLLYK